jgi:hypothetical protein
MGWLVGSLLGCLVGLLVGWLVGWLVCWLVGGLEICVYKLRIVGNAYIDMP